MNPPSDTEILKLYSAYKALTGLEVPYTMQLRFTFEAFMAAGFNEPDLACVVRYLKARIKYGRNPKESLLPRNLISRTDVFGENLAIARAEARNTRTQTPKEKVLQAAGMATEKKTEARTAGQIMAGNDAFKMFKEAMQKEGLA